MPELPEVQTIVDELNLKVKGETIIGVWPLNFKEAQNKKILNIKRRAKYIIFELSEDTIMLVHLKMTGHFLLGRWEIRNNVPYPLVEGPIKDDSYNKYVRVIFYLKSGKELGFSDLRKFGEIEFYTKEEFNNLKKIKKLGPEPLEKEFTFEKFKNIVKSTSTNIKMLLMNQEKIAGIGNLYASEILFLARVNPLRRTEDLKEKEVREVYNAIKIILERALKLKGSSVYDYRRVLGIKGSYQDSTLVYGRKGKDCPVCAGKVEYVKIGQRGTYFCPKCQK
jgi:formamidopyrimidine-DNA glycosylase